MSGLDSPIGLLGQVQVVCTRGFLVCTRGYEVSRHDTRNPKQANGCVALLSLAGNNPANQAAIVAKGVNVQPSTPKIDMFCTPGCG